MPIQAIMDWTLREIDNYARGANARMRSEMATTLWAFREGAGFNIFAFAGKRIPNIDARLNRIITGGKSGGRNSEVASVVERMNAIAKKAGMPPPRPRGRKPQAS